MLEWRTLTLSQRICGIVLLLLFATAGPFSVASAGSLSEAMTILGGISCALCMILNPACYQLAPGKMLAFEHMPRICRYLCVIGLTLFGLSYLAHSSGL